MSTASTASTITTRERAVLRALLTNDFTCRNGSIPAEYGHPSEWAVWTNCINDAAEPSGIEGRALSGVISSLAQKGFAFTDGQCVQITRAGFEIVTAG